VKRHARTTTRLAAVRPVPGRRQCRAVDVLEGGGSGSSTIENGKSGRLAWNEA
jgi:hypothetical protein